MSYCMIVYHDGASVSYVQTSTELDEGPCLVVDGLNIERFVVEGEFELSEHVINRVSIEDGVVCIDGKKAVSL